MGDWILVGMSLVVAFGWFLFWSNVLDDSEDE